MNKMNSEIRKNVKIENNVTKTDEATAAFTKYLRGEQADFTKLDRTKTGALIPELKSKETVIAKLLGYGNFDNYDEVAVYTKGYRILNKIPRMPSNIVENLVDSFKSFQHILAADIESLDEVDGIGEVRARTIKQSLKRMQEQFIFDNLI